MQARFTVASYSFHGLFEADAMTVFHYLESVRFRYNLDFADIWNGMLQSYDEPYLRKVRQQMDERELTLANLCCDGCHLWINDREAQPRLDARAEECLRAAEILGAKTVRIDAGPVETELSQEQLDTIAEKYERYCARAADFGAKLGPENHWGAMTNAAEVRKVIAAVRAKNFGLLLHMGNWGNTEGAGERTDWLNPLRIQLNAEFAPVAFHNHMMYEVCLEAEKQLPPMVEAGYKGIWSVEAHKATDEFVHVALQLALAKRALAPCDYTEYKK